MSEFDVVATGEDAEATSSGSLVFWPAIPQEQPHATVAIKMEAAGMAYLIPPRPTVIEALRRAMDRVYGAMGIKVVALDRRHWTVQKATKHVAERKVRYRQLLVAEMVNGEPTIGDIATDDNGEPLVSPETLVTLKAEFARALAMLSTGDLSAWLHSVMDRCDAQDVGRGVYFVAKRHVPIVNAVAKIAEELGIVISKPPVMKSADVTSMVMRALEAEAMKALAEVDQYLNDHTEVSEKGRKSQTEVLDAVKGKLDRYGKTFGAALSGPVAKIAELKQKMAQTFWRAKAADMGQDVSAGSRILELDDKRPAPPLAEDEPDAAINRFRNLEVDDEAPQKAAASDDDATRTIDL